MRANVSSHFSTELTVLFTTSCCFPVLCDFPNFRLTVFAVLLLVFIDVFDDLFVGVGCLILEWLVFFTLKLFVFLTTLLFVVVDEVFIAWFFFECPFTAFGFLVVFCLLVEYHELIRTHFPLRQCFPFPQLDPSAAGLKMIYKRWVQLKRITLLSTTLHSLRTTNSLHHYIFLVHWELPTYCFTFTFTLLHSSCRACCNSKTVGCRL